jgi:hypothetical protein
MCDSTNEEKVLEVAKLTLVTVDEVSILLQHLHDNTA